MKQHIKYSFCAPISIFFYVDMNYMSEPIRIMYVRFMLMQTTIRCEC